MTNREVAVTFYEEFFNQHDLSAADRYVSPEYTQHEFDVPLGRDGLKNIFTEVFRDLPSFHVDVHQVIEEGDRVVIAGYGITDPGKIECLVVDIFRVENGLLAEHWGVVQNLPEEQFGRTELI